MANNNKKDYNQTMIDEAMRILNIKLKKIKNNASIEQVSMLQRFIVDFNSSK